MRGGVGAGLPSLTKHFAASALLIAALSLSACSTASKDEGTAADADSATTTAESTTPGEPQTVEQACDVIEQGQNDLATVNQASSLEEVAERLDAISADVTNPEVAEPWNGYVKTMHSLMALASEMGASDADGMTDEQSEAEATLFSDLTAYEKQLDELCDFDWD